MARVEAHPKNASGGESLCDVAEEAVDKVELRVAVKDPKGWHVHKNGLLVARQLPRRPRRLFCRTVTLRQSTQHCAAVQLDVGLTLRSTTHRLTRHGLCGCVLLGFGI